MDVGEACHAAPAGVGDQGNTGSPGTTEEHGGSGLAEGSSVARLGLEEVLDEEEDDTFLQGDWPRFTPDAELAKKNTRPMMEIGFDSALPPNLTVVCVGPNEERRSGKRGSGVMSLGSLSGGIEQGLGSHESGHGTDNSGDGGNSKGAEVEREEDEDAAEDCGGSMRPNKKQRLTSQQVAHLQRKFVEWDGSCRKRKGEVQALARRVGLTAEQVRRRFEYLRQQKRKGNREPVLEVIVEDVESAVRARQGGARRVEVCSSLHHDGGITPSLGLVTEIVRLLKTRPGCDVNVLCRPRGGDFCYTDREFEVKTPLTCMLVSLHHKFRSQSSLFGYSIQVLLQDVRNMKAAGADGVVIGVLKPNQTIDIKRTKLLIEEASPLSVTFHRAFDDVLDPYDSLSKLLDLRSVNRLLTSGLANSAWEGRDVIKKLVEQSEGEIVIMPGAGLNISNVKELMEYTGATEVHMGTSVLEAVLAPYVPSRRRSYSYTRVSAEKVAAVVERIGGAHRKSSKERRKAKLEVVKERLFENGAAANVHGTDTGSVAGAALPVASHGGGGRVHTVLPVVTPSMGKD